MIHAFLAFTAVVASVWIGHYFGYRSGFADSEWSHDFDRCSHCGESPYDEEESR